SAGSGVGKSEAALDLVLRGHRLVARMTSRGHGSPARHGLGAATQLHQHHMEIRGDGHPQHHAPVRRRGGPRQQEDRGRGRAQRSARGRLRSARDREQQLADPRGRHSAGSDSAAGRSQHFLADRGGRAQSDPEISWDRLGAGISGEGRLAHRDGDRDRHAQARAQADEREPRGRRAQAADERAEHRADLARRGRVSGCLAPAISPGALVGAIMAMT
ncbi:MAG: hypothetical protein HC927_00455, partial [Deltaproteobacteria bacterium]|nr:hypothetical protein [Deltaproteobacteria bacterium]